MNSGARFILASLAVIVLLVVAIVWITRSGANRRPTLQSGVDLLQLAEEQTGHVELNTEGPINAPEQHRTIRMTVSPRIRQIDIIAGYEGQVISSRSYDNNGAAYAEFLAALNRAGFNQERRLDNISADAVCPLGSRTHYRVFDDEQKQNSWSAVCTDGTFNGNVNLTQDLFRAQFPDYGEITRGISMGTRGRGNTGLVL